MKCLKLEKPHEWTSLKRPKKRVAWNRCLRTRYWAISSCTTSLDTSTTAVSLVYGLCLFVAFLEVLECIAEALMSCLDTEDCESWTYEEKSSKLRCCLSRSIDIIAWAKQAHSVATLEDARANPSDKQLEILLRLYDPLLGLDVSEIALACSARA